MPTSQTQKKTQKIIPALEIFKKAKLWALKLLCLSAGILILATNSLPVLAINQNEYSSKRTELQKTIAEIQTTIDFLSEDYHVIPEGGTLQNRIDQLTEEMEKAQVATRKAEKVIEDLNLSMKENEETIDNMEKDMKDMLRSIQQQQASSPIEFIITSQDLGQLLSRMNQYNELTQRSEKLKKDILTENENLIRSRVTQESVVKNAKNAEYIIASRQDTLRELIDQTGGSEVKYQEIMAKMRSQRQDQLTELNKLDKEWMSQNQKPGSTAGGPCRFSEGRSLDVGKDYFATPATGSRSRGVLCNYHDGIDIANASGTPILAAADGVVVKASYGYGGGFGNHIIIKHTTPGGIRFYTLYAHLRNNGILVSNGQTVQKASQIGEMGTTGNSTGNHLHFMMISDSYEKSGAGCAYGSARCYNPDVYINW